LLLFFFQQVSLISPLANFIAVPVISLVAVPLSLLGILVMFGSPLLASMLFIIVDPALQGLWWLLVRLAELPMATINHAQPSIWAMVFAIPGVLLLLAPRGTPARLLSLVMFLPLVFTASNKLETGSIKMTLLDVGQGLSVVVQTANHWLVYDTGARFSAESDMGQSVVLLFLRRQGASKIDKLIISHGDNDHSGGTVSVMRGIPIEEVLTSAPRLLSAYSPIMCAAGQSWIWDKVRFTVLSPKHAFVSENDNSCVLKIQSQQGAVLLTSNIEASAENWLSETYVLIAPHHGSKTSSTIGFLQAVQPEYVLIPSGYRSQFGHPHMEVLARYEQIKAKWLNSADSGAITISVRDGSWVAQALRDTDSKYWNVK
jgi:competence protein ComEC